MGVVRIIVRIESKKRILEIEEKLSEESRKKHVG